MAKKFYSKTRLAIMLPAGVLSMGILLYITAFLPAFAEGSSTDFSVEIQQALSITVPESAALELKPNTNNGFGSTTASVTVSTNNPTGYTLSVNASSTNLTDGQSHTIPTLGTGTFTEATFPANKWGLSIANDNNYTAASTEDILVKQTELPSTSDTNTIGLAAKVDMTQPIGTYVTTLNFTVIANEPPCEGTKLGGVCVTYLQDFYENTSTIAAAMTEGQVYTFKDERDNEVYNVKKLADGNVWLAENLRLGGSSAIDLTPNDTNIATNWTLPASGTANFTSSTGYTTAAINASLKNEPQGADEYSPAGKIGNFYNYCAASAGTYCYASGSGTGNATEDICPKGWRMPTGGSSGEYNALYTAYSSNAANFQSALVTPLSGGFTNGSADGQGDFGIFWSSTFYNGNNGNNMHGPAVLSSDVDLTYSFLRCTGGSVRCVADNTKYMQDVDEWKDELDVGDSIQAKDKRDGETYTVAKLADGKIWMLDNLALDLTNSDVQANLTSSTTNASDTSLGYLKNGGGTSPYTAYAVAAATSTNYSNRPAINTGSINVVPTDSLSTAGGWKVGVYYNYCAASAGSYCYSSSSSSGNATEDICPKGWRMPTGNAGEYQALYAAYSSNYTNFRNALHLPRSGYFYNGSAGYQGSTGFFWSSTRYDNYRMYLLYATTSNIYPAEYNSRNYNSSVRCVAGS